MDAPVYIHTYIYTYNYMRGKEVNVDKDYAGYINKVITLLGLMLKGAVDLINDRQERQQFIRTHRRQLADVMG